MPASRPEVQTLVARKALSRVPAAASRSPTTPSALPYIGELSITEPPASNSTRQHLGERRALGRRGGRHRRSARCRSRPRAAVSPVEGILRVCMRGPVCAAAGAATRAAPAKLEEGGARKGHGEPNAIWKSWPSAASLDRTAIHGHARRLGKAREREIPGHRLAVWSGFSAWSMSTSRDHGRYSTRSSADLAVGLEASAPSRVVSAKACGSGSGL